MPIIQVEGCNTTACFIYASNCDFPFKNLYILCTGCTHVLLFCYRTFMSQLFQVLLSPFFFHSERTIPTLNLDLRDDKQFFIDHPGAVPITTAQVRVTADILPLSCFGGVHCVPSLSFQYLIYFFIPTLRVRN